MEPIFRIKPSLRLNMEGITAFDTRNAPKVFNSKALRIWSMVASAMGPKEEVIVSFSSLRITDKAESPSQTGIRKVRTHQ